MDKRKNNLVHKANNENVYLHRENIMKMIAKIQDEKFLKRIYISLRDYISEKQE